MAPRLGFTTLPYGRVVSTTQAEQAVIPSGGDLPSDLTAAFNPLASIKRTLAENKTVVFIMAGVLLTLALLKRR